MYRIWYLFTGQNFRVNQIKVEPTNKKQDPEFLESSKTRYNQINGNEIWQAASPIIILMAVFGESRMCFHNSNTKKYLMFLYAVFIALVVVWVLIVNFSETDFVYLFTPVASKYVINIILTTFLVGSGPTRFYAKMLEVDTVLGVVKIGNLYTITRRQVLLAIFFFFFNVSITALFWMLIDIRGIDIAMLFSMDAVRLIVDFNYTYIILAYVWLKKRIEILRLKLEYKLTLKVYSKRKIRLYPWYVFWVPEEILNPMFGATYEVRDLSIGYIGIVECKEQLNLINNLYWLSTLMILVPEVITVAYKVIQYIQFQQLNITYAVKLLLLYTRRIVLAFAPCVAAELTNSEVKTIRSLLAQRLYDRNIAASERRQLQDLLLLTETRPMTYTVYSVFDIDYSMIFGFFSVLFTNVILLVQITNLYK